MENLQFIFTKFMKILSREYKSECNNFLLIWYINSYFVISIFVLLITCITTYSRVSATKKAKEDVQHASVLFTGTVKLPNSAIHISKTTKPISTKFIYFLPYIYTTSHIKTHTNTHTHTYT